MMKNVYYIYNDILDEKFSWRWRILYNKYHLTPSDTIKPIIVGLKISPIDRADTANPLITLAYVGAKSTGITLCNKM